MRYSQMKVSVIVPSFNRIGFIGHTVDSVLTQSHHDLEVIVVDDGSLDGTGAYLKSRYYADYRFRYIWQVNRERAVARNHGIKCAQGDYIAFLDSDDLWMPDKLLRQMDCLEAHPDAVMVHTGWAQRYDDGTTVPFILKNEAHLRRDMLATLVYANMIGSATPLVRRSVFDQIAGFNEDPELLCFEDWELWTRIAALGPVDYVPEPLAMRRVHAGNTERPLTPQVYGRFVRSVLKAVDRGQQAVVRQAARERFWTEIRAAVSRGDQKTAGAFLWREFMCMGFRSVAADMLANRRMIGRMKHR